MEIKFFEYLINIGLINKESFSNLVLNFYNKRSNNNFEEKMNLLLLDFFDNLTKKEKDYMSINLVKNFLQTEFVKKIEKLKRIFMIIKGKISKIKLKYFFKWRFFSLMNKYEEIKTFQYYEKLNNSIQKINSKIKRYRNIPEKLDNFMTMKNDSRRERKKTIINKSQKKKSKNISSYIESTAKKYDSTKESIGPYKKNYKNYSERLSSASQKEQQELKECTFSPKINDYTINRNSNNKNINNKESKEKMTLKVFNKLYNDKIIYKNKIKYSKEKYEKKFKEENTFHPKINYNNSFSKKLSKENKSFEERQKIYLEKKFKNRENITKELDDNFSKLYSFIPEVNLSSSKINNVPHTELKNQVSIMNYYSSRAGEGIISKHQSPFIRLYEESKNRNLRKIKREKEYKNFINNMANISCKKEINNVNYEKLNELYLYDKKNDIIRKTKQKVENEEGSTFKPNIYINNSSKNITSGFYERNEKFIKDKQDFIEYSIKERDKDFNNNKENKIVDNFSKKIKNKIIRNIVKRLSNEYNEN